MDSQQLVSGSQPTSSEAEHGDQPYRGSCDPCNCCYSSRMPLGRPRSKRKKLTRPQHPVTHPVSRENATLPTNRVASSPESRGDIATVQPDQFTFLALPRSGQDGSGRIDHMPPHQLYPEPGRDLLAATVSQPSTEACACLSEQYLLLEQLRLKSRLIVPEDLHLLRETIRKAIMILNCQHCPLRYFSIIQNSVILGVVCLCIGECYARILEIIDTETKRLERNGEHKRVRFANVDEDGSYHASLPGDSSLFSVNLVPTEWRTIMRNVVKEEIFDVIRNDFCFIKLVQLLEERQTRWHQDPPAPDCPPSYRSSCQLPDRVPTCLLLVNDIKRLIGSLAL
ncbi:hypothetical protein BDW71DRAFT_213314 [Aspergillus fruticulosus]